MSSHEYAGSGELVPSGLRAYRHFKSWDNLLWPTIVGSVCIINPGVNVARCHARSSYAAVIGSRRNPMPKCKECGGTGIVRWRRPNPVDFASYLTYLKGGDVSPVEPIDYTVIEDTCPCSDGECKPPDVRCSCGFYSSYSPYTNFFAITLDDAKRDRAAAQRGAAGHHYPRDYNLPPVFGVIEASGRCLMGSKGVRSERMEVKALALDHEHAHFSSFIERGGTIDLTKLGAKYEVPVFDHIERMIEEFPQPDLSNLLKNQEG